jgi:hypothetical protein
LLLLREQIAQEIEAFHSPLKHNNSSDHRDGWNTAIRIAARVARTGQEQETPNQ